MIKNAQITGTDLGNVANGMFTLWLHLDYSGSGQGFGGYGMDDYNKDTKRREGSAYGMEFIKAILSAVGVEKWEDLKGKYIRVVVDDDINHKILGIGHITEDKWFRPEIDLDWCKSK